MKRINLLMAAFLALIMVLPAAAQVKLGITGGPNFANLSGDDPEGTKIEFSGRTVFGAGGVLELALGESVALTFQPMYLQKGAEAPLGDGITGIFKAAYLEVPAFIKISFGTNNTRPYLMAGPSLGFNLSSDLELSVDGFQTTSDFKDLTSSTDFSLGFGGGINFQLENVSLFVEGRYMLGVTDIAKAGTLTVFGMPVEFEDANIKTRGIQIMGGVLFPLGSK